MTEEASNPFLLTMLTSKPLTADANTSFKLNPCINIPKTAASIEEKIITGSVGYFFTAPNNIRAGGNKDRKSTRLNSSHVSISYAVFCLKKKKAAQIG